MGTRSDFTANDAGRVLIGLLIIELFLVAIFAADFLLGKPSYSLHLLFDLDGEACIPAWFSSMQLFAVGALLLLSCRITSPGDRPARYFIALAGVGFIYLSADEAGMIHERLGAMLRHMEYRLKFKGGYGTWISVYLAIGVAVLAASFRHLVSLLQFYRKETMIALGGFGTLLFGAVGLEIVSYQFLRSGSTPFLYMVEVALEELLEMAGVSIIFYGVALFALKKLHAESATVATGERGAAPATIAGPEPFPAHIAGKVAIPPQNYRPRGEL